MPRVWTLTLLLIKCLSAVVSGDESGEEEGEGSGGEVNLRAQQQQLEAEKQAILQNKELLDEVSLESTGL